MKKLAVIIVFGVFLSLNLSSSAPCASSSGGHSGGGHSSGGWHGGGSYGGGYRGYYGGGYRGYYGGWYGFGFGPWGYPYAYPYSYPSYYPYSYPYPSYPNTYAQPPVYSEPTYSEPEQSYWYYCQDAQAYYPYVKSCPGGWTRVVPTPPRPGEEGVTQ